MNTHGLLMMLLSITAWLGDVPHLAALWARLLLSQVSLELVYALPAIALCHARIQGSGLADLIPVQKSFGANGVSHD